MTTPSEGVEGQGLARRLLDSLDAGQLPDWDAFQRAYGAWLLHVAGRCRARYPMLGNHFDSSEELVNDFLVEKVYPPRQAHLMLAGPANGECPLWPRLAASLMNYCVDLVRSPSVRRSETPRAVAPAAAPEPMDLPDYEDVAAVIGRQMEAIRASFPHVQGAPYRIALLLRLRLDWAGVFDGVTLQQPEGMGSIELSLPALESLTAWTTEETGVRLGESLLNLGSAWEALKPLLLAAANRRLSASDVSKTLHVPRDLWDQWSSRGRRRLKQDMGEEYTEVFALWG